MYPARPDVIEYSIGFTKADQRGCRVDRHDTRQYLIRVKSLEADSPTDFEGSLNSVSNPLSRSSSLYCILPYCFSLFRLHCLRLSAEFFSLSLYLTIFLVSDGVRGSPLFVGWVNCAPVFLSQKWKIYCYIGFLNVFVQYCKIFVINMMIIIIIGDGTFPFFFAKSDI